jgi:hypothetical protein
LRSKRPCLDGLGQIGSQQEFEHRRGIHDDQRRSRSVRMTSVGEVLPR